MLLARVPRIATPRSTSSAAIRPVPVVEVVLGVAPGGTGPAEGCAVMPRACPAAGHGRVGRPGDLPGRAYTFRWTSGPSSFGRLRVRPSVPACAVCSFRCREIGPLTDRSRDDGPNTPHGRGQSAELAAARRAFAEVAGNRARRARPVCDPGAMTLPTEPAVVPDLAR